jgi:hypothetical protein
VFIDKLLISIFDSRLVLIKKYPGFTSSNSVDKVLFINVGFKQVYSSYKSIIEQIAYIFLCKNGKKFLGVNFALHVLDLLLQRPGVLEFKIGYINNFKA